MTALLQRTLTQPHQVVNYTVTQWSALLSQAYGTQLLAALGECLQQHGLMSHVPECTMWHFQSIARRVAIHHADAKKETNTIFEALQTIGVTPVLLKGAAYLYDNDVNARHRFFTDIDILVPEHQLDMVIDTLHRHDWHFGEVSDYDKHYYREWMHELPPLTHTLRQTTLDVHFRLIPRISRLKFEQSLIDKELNEQRTLPAHYKIMHAVVHLMTETEYQKGLRDLYDIYQLINQAITHDTLSDVLEAAIKLKVKHQLIYVLYAIETLFFITWPASIQDFISQHKPGSLRLTIMKWALPKAICDYHRPTLGSPARLAATFMFIRGHWLKMPLNILLLHSWHKLQSLFSKD